MSDETAITPVASPAKNDRMLFWGCFVALVATAFAFNIRANVVGTWGTVFDLSETQKGELMGAGFWPFGLSIVLFSLIIDKVGYGKSMIFAFACHVASVIVTVFATGYWGLYVGSCLCGLAAGTVEAVVNPVVASMYPKSKTKMLTILHAGWAGGVALCGAIVMTLGLVGGVDWKTKVALLLIPTVLYALMLLKRKFPVSERVAAGVPYRDMLKEAGALGCLIVTYMIIMEINRVCQFGNLVKTDVLNLPNAWLTGVMVVIVGGYLIYTRTLGRLMYAFLLIVMIMLAITELGTDGWMKELRDPAMNKIGLDGGWILVYTATIMMVLRFCIGPIEKRLKPLGVLLVSSLFAAAGLYFLAGAEGKWLILITATIYGVGQTFFWPVTIGLCAERFPKGGALTINAIAGVGMLGVGIIGLPLMGNLQDKEIDTTLQPKKAIYARVIDPKEKSSVFGKYKSLDGAKKNAIYDKVALHDYPMKLATKKAAEAVKGEMSKQERKKAIEAGAAKLVAAGDFVKTLNSDEGYQVLVRNSYDHLVRAAGDEESKSHDAMVAGLKEKGALVSEEEYEKLAADKKVLDDVTMEAKKTAMAKISVLPLIMAACYIGLIIYFKKKGGYKAIDLVAEGTPPE